MRSIIAALVATILVAGLPGEGHAKDDCGADYTIRSGDSLGKVARRCGHTVKSILAANPEIKDPGRISVGQSIALPGHAAVARETSVDAATTEETVLKGRIFAGRWCALIETAEGEIFGLASPKHSFRSDTIVEIKGRKIGGTDCGQTHTIAVSELSNAGLKF